MLTFRLKKPVADTCQSNFSGSVLISVPKCGGISADGPTLGWDSIKSWPVVSYSVDQSYGNDTKDAHVYWVLPNAAIGSISEMNELNSITTDWDDAQRNHPRIIP